MPPKTKKQNIIVDKITIENSINGNKKIQQNINDMKLKVEENKTNVQQVEIGSKPPKEKKPRKPMTPEHKAKLAEASKKGLEKIRANKESKLKQGLQPVKQKKTPKVNELTNKVNQIQDMVMTLSNNLKNKTIDIIDKKIEIEHVEPVSAVFEKKEEIIPPVIDKIEIEKKEPEIKEIKQENQDNDIKTKNGNIQSNNSVNYKIPQNKRNINFVPYSQSEQSNGKVRKYRK